VARPGTGSVWVLDRLAEPVWGIRCREGLRPANAAFGGAGRKTLYITEADSGTVQTAELDAPGCPMYSRLE
jgi:gluconolactonase